MTKRKRYLLCGHGESLPMAEDGATSLSSVLEELAVEVAVGSLYLQLVHEYPDMTIRLFLFNARIKEGIPKLLEHQQLRWIKAEETYDYHFCPADEEILYRIRRDAGCGLDRAKQFI